MHEVLVNRLGGLSLPRKSVVRLTDMTLDVYRGRKTTIQQQCNNATTTVSDYETLLERDQDLNGIKMVREEQVLSFDS